jgi:murein DD-endopeptidase MepM/ murein hydrolase activator NlpD
MTHAWRVVWLLGWVCAERSFAYDESWKGVLRDDPNAQLTSCHEASIDTAEPWRRVIRGAPNAQLTSCHGERIDIVVNGNPIRGIHAGVDVGVCGNEIMPLTQGTFIEIDFHTAFGNYVIVRDTDGLYSFFAHLAYQDLISASREGSSVLRDSEGRLEVIGRAGRTGTAQNGCHLHFERRTFDTPYIEASPPPCRANVYPLRLEDSALSQCFLENWDDPNLPMIGEFHPDAPRPPGVAEPAYPQSPVNSFDWTRAFRKTYGDMNYAAPDERWIGRPHANNGGSHAVHLWAPHGESQLSDGVLIQDLKAPKEPIGWDHGLTALVANIAEREVFFLRTGFWNVYMNHGGPWNLGAPTSNEERQAGFVINGTPWEDEGSVQTFERGTLFFADFLPNWYPTVDEVALIIDGQATPLSNSLEIQSLYAAIGISLQGNPYCRSPCTDLGMFRGLRYELRSDVPLTQVSWRGDSERAKASGQPAPTLAADLQTFSFMAPRCSSSRRAMYLQVPSNPASPVRRPCGFPMSSTLTRRLTSPPGTPWGQRQSVVAWHVFHAARRSIPSGRLLCRATPLLLRRGS